MDAIHTTKVIHTISVWKIAYALLYLEITIMFGEESNFDIPITKLSFNVLIYPWKVLQKTFSWQSPTRTGILTPLNELLWDA